MDQLALRIASLLILLGVIACSEDVPGLGQPVVERPTGHVPPPEQLNWSPTGEWIVFLETGRLQVIRAGDLTERHGISGQGGYDHPIWAPDGVRLTYDHAPQLSSSDVWVSEPLSGKTPKPLTKNIRSDEFPTWSPDGERIAFQTFRKGNWDIWIVDSNGFRDPVPFVSHAAKDQMPAWSPGGETIAFVSDRNGSQNLWVQPVDGNDDTAWQLTDNSEGDAVPLWSPDGSKIAYQSKRSGKWYLYVVEAVPGAPTRRVSASDGVLFPNWSPDSEYLVFETDGSGWLVRADGQGKQVEIVKGLNPIWSPDGTRIAYVKWDGERYRIEIQEQTTDLEW